MNYATADIPVAASRLASSFSDGGISQPVGLTVVFARNMGDRKLERTRQFSAGPMQRIESRAATRVFTSHLLDHDFRIGKHMEGSGTKLYSELQRFEKSSILGNIVVVMSDRFFDFDSSVSRTIDHYSNAGGAGIPERSTINVGNKIRHICDELEQQCVTYLPPSRR